MYFQPRSSTLCRAFTLIELLAVIAIVAILTSIVLGSGQRASQASQIARAKAELAALSAALESYKVQHGDYPRTDNEAALVQALIGKRGPTGASLLPASRGLIEAAKFTFAPADPFVAAAAVILDPWGRPYRYDYKSSAAWTNPSFVLYSAGPDGADSAVLLAGGFPDISAPDNVDNLYANRN